jgi:hypothetical protein
VVYGVQAVNRKESEDRPVLAVADARKVDWRS